MSVGFVRIVPFDKSCARSAFDCGTEELNSYLKQIISQDIKRRLTNGFVMLADGSDRVIGYYTLSAMSVLLDELPEDRARKLRYPVIPAALLGRLAVDKRYRGNGLGKLLLYDAVERARQAQVACHALIVDAKDAAAKDFYSSFGFEALKNADLRLFFIL